METEGSGDAERLLELREERLKLEREAIEIERERLAAERTRLAAEARLAATRHPFFGVFSVSFLALACFAVGILAGIAVADARIGRQRDARIREALRQLGSDFAIGTNSVPAGGSSTRRDVSIVVFQ